MFGVGFRTPAKGAQPIPSPQKPESPRRNEGTSEALVETGSLTKVRRSIGDWEKGNTGLKRTPPPGKPGQTLPRKTTGTTAAVSLGTELVVPKGRVAEAKACLVRAKLAINSSRNLKAEIKTQVIAAVESLYRLVKEAEAAKPSTPSPAGEPDVPCVARPSGNATLETLEEHSRLLKESRDLTVEVLREVRKQGEQVAATALGVGALKNQIETVKENDNKVLEGISYAAVAATQKRQNRLTNIPQPVHSVVVSSADDQDSSEDVLVKLRTAVDARTSGIRVDRLRKAKDQKVVLGCRSREDLDKVMGKLKAGNPTLHAKEVQNRDPLVILLGVLNYNSDEDVLGALNSQNGHLLGTIPAVDYRASVRFRRKARNPLESHVVLQVSPQVWQTLTEAGKVHLDLQRVVVKDQTPLTTCSRCLGYGHGRKTCPESADTCSHCAGKHLRSECPVWRAGESPTCCNCRSARLDRTDHSSFDVVCPVRAKWDALARSRVAYC